MQKLGQYTQVLCRYRHCNISDGIIMIRVFKVAIGSQPVGATKQTLTNMLQGYAASCKKFNCVPPVVHADGGCGPRPMMWTCRGKLYPQRHVCQPGTSQWHGGLSTYMSAQQYCKTVRIQQVRTCPSRRICRRHEVLPDPACRCLSPFCKFSDWGMSKLFCNTCEQNLQKWMALAAVGCFCKFVLW